MVTKFSWYEESIKEEEEYSEKSVVRQGTTFADKVRQGNNNNNKLSSSKKKCSTCNPRKHMQKHTITVIGGIQFHHDMCYRNIIIVTPIEHHTSLYGQNISGLFSTIKEFCDNWNIKDYTIVYDHKTDTNEHTKIKIRVDEDTIKRIRDTHFKVIEMEKSRRQI